MIEVMVHLKESSQKIIHKAENTYTKGRLFCVYVKDENKVYKYPMDNIWRIVEEYEKV